MVYKRIKIDLTEAQAKKALHGKSIRLSATQIGKGDAVSLHPANAKIVERAALKNKGCNIMFSHGELADTAKHMNGSGFWNNIWSGLKKGWSVLKDSGVLSAAADAAVAPLSAYSGQPSLINSGRALLKKTTGIGMPKKRRTKAERKELLVARGLYLS